MTFAGMIVGFLMVILLGRTGFIPQMFERMTGTPFLSGIGYQFPGLILAYLYFEIPRETLTLESALSKLDSRLEQAARSLGANRWQVFRLVGEWSIPGAGVIDSHSWRPFAKIRQ